MQGKTAQDHPEKAPLIKALSVTAFVYLLSALEIAVSLCGPPYLAGYSSTGGGDMRVSTGFAAVYPEPHHILINFAVDCGLAWIMYLAALKTKGKARTAAALQVVLLAALAQWMMFVLLHLEPLVSTALLVLVLSFCWGYVDQVTRREKQLSEKNDVKLSLKEQDLRQAHLQLVKQDEADRRLLASDLHDQVLNDLKSLKQAVQKLKEKTDESERLSATGEIEGLLESTTVQVREVMENLTPSVLENLGLSSALDDLLRRSGSKGKLKVRFKNDAPDDLKKLSRIEELLLFRTVQEALSNIVKHAGAGKVEMTIGKQADELIVTIADDGVGIPVDKDRGQSRGLRYMRQRADLMGARIAWLPGRDQKGCLVEIKFDLKEPRE